MSMLVARTSLQEAVLRRREQLCAVARADRAGREHLGVRAAPAGEQLLVDPVEFAALEPRLVRLARRRIARDLDDHVGPEAQLGSGHDLVPIDAARGDVLADA